MPRTRRSLAAAAKPPPVASSRVTRQSIKLELPEVGDEIVEGRVLRSRQTKTPSSAETNRSRNTNSRASTSSTKTPKPKPKIVPVLKLQLPKTPATKAKGRGRPASKTPAGKPKPKALITEEDGDDYDDEYNEEPDDDDDTDAVMEEEDDNEEDDFEAEEIDEEEDDERMPSDVEMEEKPKRKSFPQNRTAQKRKKVSIATGELPGSHSRLKMIGENKRFKFRASSCANSKVTPFNIQEYLVSSRATRGAFYANLSEGGCVQELLNAKDVTFNPSVPDSENLTKWLDRSSIKFAFRPDFISKKKHEHVMSIKSSPPPSLIPETSLRIFGSNSFKFSFGSAKHDMNSFLVDAMTKSPKLVSNKNVYEALEEVSKCAESKKQKIQALFCGGPILCIKPAPLCTSEGYQVVAITTAADEITWQHQPGMPSYIQFWKFSGLLTMENPSLWFLLRIENIGTISDMCWCPYFHEKVEQTENSGIFGYLAITTDTGKIMIFKINKEIDLPSDNPPVVVSTPSFVFEHPTVSVNISNKNEILSQSMIDEYSNDVPGSSELEISGIAESVASTSTAPAPKKRAPRKRKRALKKIVEEPMDDDVIIDEDVTMEDVEKPQEKEVEISEVAVVEAADNDATIEEDKENVTNEVTMERAEIDEAPFICVDWSSFSKCKDIVAISSTGWIIFYEITEGSEAKDALYDISWDSSPLSAKWISEDIIAVGFTSKIIIYYDVNTKERIFEDNTARSVGTLVATQPVLFPGAFSYDAVRAIPEDSNQQQYQVGVYQVINRETQTGLVVPLPNKHVGQAFNLSVCETSGIIGSVGCDGRLLESLNGRVACRDEENDYACFAYRPTLQLVRHKFDNQQQKTDFDLSLDTVEMKPDANAIERCGEPIVSHDKVVSSNWLEIRVGDAALIDQEKGSKAWSSVHVEKMTFDRRMESLTRVEFSKITPGLAITGGEAGIVFIIPTSL